MTYICTDCGKEYRKTNTDTTMHRGICDKCGKEGDLCHIRHYKWMKP
jgi:ssDNA-binding Zn-finger/Zn-ribbon topoisomerase 1